MPLDHWLAFVFASAIMLAIPGPTVVLVASYTLGYGRRSALAVVAGVAFGGLTAMTASMLGLGAVLAASASVFTGLRWIGGAYLVFLGIKLWRAPAVSVDAEGGARKGPLRLFLHGYGVTALNPKAVVFFVAFVPQFMVPGVPFAQQAAILIVTFMTMDVLNSLIYVALASAARHRLHEPRAQKAVNRAGGTLLAGAGVLAIGLRPAAS